MLWGCFLTFSLNISLFCHNLCCCFFPPFFYFFFWGVVEEGCLAVAEGGPPSSIKESKVKFFLVCFYLSGYSYMLEIFVFYCIFFLVTILTGIKFTAPLYGVAVRLCKPWKRMRAFFSLPWERLPCHCSHSELSRSRAHLNNRVFSAWRSPGLLLSRGQPCCHRHKLI